MRRIYEPLFLAGVLLITLIGCGGDDPIPPTGEGGDPDVNVTPDVVPEEDIDTPPEDVQVTVPCENTHPSCESFLCPGDDVRGAIGNALPGDVVCLGSGTYAFNQKLSMGLSGVQLIGAGPEETILDFGGQDTGGPSISVGGHGCVIENLQILNGADAGIYGEKLVEISVFDVKVLWNSEDATLRGRVGVRIDDSTMVRVTGVDVSGAREAGVQIENSDEVLVSESTVSANTIGIAYVNMVDAEIRDVTSIENAVGYLLINTPDGDVVDGNRIKLGYSVAGQNNGENVAPSDSLYRKLPSGTGMAIVATDTTEIVNFSVQENSGFSVLLMSYTDDFFGAVEGEGNRYPRNTYIHNTSFGANGENPAGLALDVQPIPPVEVFAWDGCLPEGEDESSTLGNCFQNNNKNSANQREEFSSPVDFVNFKACADEPQYSYDISPFECAGQELPNIEPGLVEGDDDEGGEGGEEAASEENQDG